MIQSLPAATSDRKLMENKASGSLAGAERIFLAAMIVWTLLQISRVVAIPLISEINAGGDSEAWRYPAYLDLFAALFALPLAWAFIAKRGLLTWAFGIVYWSISIVDHFGNFVTTANVAPPSIADGMSNPYLPAAVMTVFDVLFLTLMFFPRFRRMFFTLHHSDILPG